MRVTVVSTARAAALLILAGVTPSYSQALLQTLFGGSSNGIAGPAAAISIPTAVTTAPNGDIYVTLKGTHQIVRIDTSDGVWQFAGTGGSGSSGDGGAASAATFNTPVSLAMDSAGNMYIADSAANCIRRISSGGIVSTIAGTGKSGYTGDGGPATQATLNNPSAVAVDAAGNVYIADAWNNVVRKVTPNGLIATFAGTGAKGRNATPITALGAPLNTPSGLAVDAAGNIYVADTGNNWVKVVTPDGMISRYAGADTLSGPFGGGNPNIALDATLTNPTGIAFDHTGNLYIVEYGQGRIMQVTPGGAISSFAGTGTPGTVGDGGLAKYASLNALGVGVDANNNVIIADGVSNKVRIVTADGIINTLAGDGQQFFTPRGMVIVGNSLYFSDPSNNVVRKVDLTTGQFSLAAGIGLANYYGDGSDAAGASLNAPQGIAVDSSGNLYIADSNNHVIRKVTTAGIITTVAGDHTAGTTGDGGAATSAELNQPYAVAVDTSNNLYILERTGNVIRKVDSNGTISTIAGTGTAGSLSSETGAALSQAFNYPQALYLEPSGSLLIADTNNNRIRRYSNGTLTTVAGGKSPGFGGDGGAAASAVLSGPQGVSEDSSGNIYIADSGNQRIRRTGSDGTINTLAGNGQSGYNGDGSPATAYSLDFPAGVLPYSGCTTIIADTQNQRVRGLISPVAYTISSNPPGLQLLVDGQTLSSPATVQLIPNQAHTINAVSPQSGSAGVQYVSSGAQQLTPACSQTTGSYTFNLVTQYSLSVSSDDGGSVTQAATWQNAGATVTLQATPQTGYVFSGWEGDCTGAGVCNLTMNVPHSVKADFAPAQTQQPSITDGGVVGAGISSPAVTALSANAIASVFGSGFAPASTASTAKLVGSAISSELDGVCVFVGGVKAPVMALTATQINFQVPQIASAGNSTVQVATGCGTSTEARSNTASVPVQSATPEFFYFTHPSGGQNPIAAVNAITGVNVGSPGTLSGSTFTPAKPGDTLTLYATGLGATNPAFSAGQIANAAAPITGTIQVTIGSTTLSAADILYAGVSPSSAGLYQVNLQVPASTPNGSVQVQLSVNGITSPAGYIAIQQ